MSIWNDCQKYNALPFYGFPVVPSFKDGVLSFEFPEGYAPNGSQTDRVAKKLLELFDGEILEVTEYIVRVRVDENSLAIALYTIFLEED